MNKPTLFRIVDSSGLPLYAFSVSGLKVTVAETRFMAALNSFASPVRLATELERASSEHADDFGSLIFVPVPTESIKECDYARQVTAKFVLPSKAGSRILVEDATCRSWESSARELGLSDKEKIKRLTEALQTVLDTPKGGSKSAGTWNNAERIAKEAMNSAAESDSIK